MADRRPTATILTTIGPLPDESSPTVRWRSLAVERARTGDVDAFEALVEADLGAAFRTALAILGSEADARDACQEAFIHAWRELPRLRDPDRFEAWLGRILVNACRSALRKRGRQSIREIPIDGASGPALRSMTSALDDRLGEREALDRAFGRLSMRDRTVLVLRYLDERPLAEIAVVLGVPVGTVKSRLHAARRAFERSLEVTR